MKAIINYIRYRELYQRGILTDVTNVVNNLVYIVFVMAVVQIISTVALIIHW